MNGYYSRLESVLEEQFKDTPRYSLPVKINHAAKRSLDVILGTVGLVVSAPIIAVMGLATLYDSGSPILFKQERIGYRGEHIFIYKIRVMYNNSEEKMIQNELSIPQAYLSPQSSEMYTPIGKILDYTRLNELPQLWNVIKGEMSIVGNRPASMYFAQQLLDIPGYLRKFESKPGLIGYSQLKPRSEIMNSEKYIDEIKYSQIYATGNVFFEDLKILFKTVKMYYNMLTSKKYNGRINILES